MFRPLLSKYRGTPQTCHELLYVLSFVFLLSCSSTVLRTVNCVAREVFPTDISAQSSEPNAAVSTAWFDPANFHFMYGISIAVFVGAVLLGAMVSYFNVSLFRHSRIGPGVGNGFWGVNGIMELSFGDILFVLLYLGAVAIAAIGYNFVTGAQFTTALGFACSIIMGMMLFPVTRFNALSYILGISVERMVKYHRWMARILWIGVTIHFIIMARTYSTQFLLSTNGTTGGNVYGIVAWVFLTALLLTSFEPIRRYFYTAFLFFHFVFFVPTLLFTCLHVRQAFPLVVISGGLYLIDWLHRLYMLFRSPKVTMSRVGEEHLKIMIQPSQRFHWSAGQYIFVQIGWETDAHPFSITNAPDTDNGDICIIVKNMGPSTATDRLYQSCVAVQEKANSIQPIPIRFMGPYGSLSVPFEKYNTLYLCAGGVGITPIASILMFLLAHPEAYKCVKNVVLLWSVRQEALIEEYRDLLLKASQSHDFSIKSAVYHTSSDPYACLEIPISQGRPNILEVLLGTPPPQGEAAAMYVCGPDQFSASCINQARKLACKVHIHTENFYL